MKTGKRLIAWMLTLILLVGTIPAEALAGFMLPQGLTGVEDEAFDGSFRVEGLVTLPTDMTYLGSNIFRGTRLYALRVPSGVENIPPQGLAGTAYVWLEGERTAAEPGAFEGVLYVFGPSGSAAQAQAEADGAQFICTDSVCCEDGFYYLCESDGATLLCAVDGTRMNGSVTVPESLSDGTRVQTLSAHAMHGCDGLTQVKLPQGILESAGAMDGAPYAVKEYYSVDTFCITSIRASHDRVNPDTEVTWLAQTNSIGAVEYYFTVQKQDDTIVSRSRAFRSSAEYQDSNRHTVLLTEPGQYTATVTCRDESGTEISATSAPVQVLAPEISFIGLSSAAAAVREGEDVVWTAETTGGNGAITYRYTLIKDGQKVEEKESLEPTYTLSAAQAGTYVLIASVNDDISDPISLRSAETVVYTAEAACPASPVLLSPAFAQSESEASAMEADSIDLVWETVPYAAQYGVIVSLYENGAWSDVLHTAISGEKTAYTLSAALFANLQVQTLVRIGLYSSNLESSEPRWYYVSLTPHVIDTSITVNGGSKAYWYEGYYGGGAQTFTVASELPWTVTAKNGDDWYRTSINGDELTVTMLDNDTGTDLQETLTLSNGVSTASIAIRHYCFTMAPVVTEPADGFTADEPARLPMEPAAEINIADNGCTVFAEIQEPSGSGWKTVWSDASASSTTTLYPRAIGLKAGTVYRLRLSGYRSYWDSTLHKDALVSERYIVFEEEAQSVSFIGKTEHTINIDTYRGIDVTVKGGTPTISTDVTWLTSELNENYTFLSIDAAENTTAVERTGHITLSCGSAKAVLTVVQPSGIPALLRPTVLSESQSSPTKLYMNADVEWYSFSALCQSMTFSVLENGAFTELYTDTGDDRCILSIDYSELSTSSTYRLSITKGTVTLHYYVKFAATSSYIMLDGDDYSTDRVPSSGGSVNLTLQSTGSWTATVDDTWLAVSSTSGSSTSGKSITITAQPNHTGIKREGTVTFKRGSYHQATAIIVQYPVAKSLVSYWSFSGAEHTIMGGDADHERLFIDTEDQWKVSTSESWIGFNSACTTKTKSDYGPYEQNVYVTELPAGSQPRTGTITVTSGSFTKTVQLTQLPMLDIPLLTNVFSTDKSAPTVFEHDDLVISWKGEPYAASYRIYAYLTSFDDSTSIIDRKILADGSDTYTFTIPQSWMKPDTGDRCYYRIYAYDTAGNSYNHYHYFQVVSDEGVFADGKKTSILSGLSDLGDSGSYTITSSAPWTASADAGWITLSTMSGANGDTLEVGAAPNYGEARSGKVTLRCGDNTAVINVRQYAYIPRAAMLKDSGLSMDMSQPTVLPASTQSLTLSWDREYQATYYQLRLYQVHSTSKEQYVHAYGRDDTLLYSGANLNPKDETHTITGLSLTPGALYMLDFYRTEPEGRTAKSHYYFMAETTQTPYVYIYDDSLAETEEFGSAEEQSRYAITSNATWTARSDSEWLMVGDEGYTQAELLEEGDVPEDYCTYTAMYDELVISALDNDSGKTRTGRVTISVPGGNTAVITIVQPRSCNAAVLQSPALTDDKNNPAALPFGNVALRWSASPDGAGRYTVTLREKLPGESRYYEIESETVTGTSYTIPQSLLTENADYILMLETWVDSQYTVCRTYRFHMNFLNALSVTANVNWTDTSASVEAHASGGSGAGYEYSFGLLRNGELIDGTLWHDSLNKYAFRFSGSGTYQLKVYVSDSKGQEASFIVSEHVVGQSAQERYIAVTPSSWTPTAEGGVCTVQVSANGEWTCSSNAPWLSVDAESGVPVITAMANSGVSARIGTLTFRCGSVSTSFTVTQTGTQIADDSSVSLSKNSWVITSDSAASFAAKVTSSGSWSVTACPSWIYAAPMSGGNGETLSLYATPNAGNGREGVVTVSSGSASASVTVQQLGVDALPAVLSFTMSHSGVSTGQEVTFTAETFQADSVMLVVDGTRYETHSVIGGKVTFTRAFSSGGERAVQLLPLRNTLEGSLSPAQTLTVGSQGKLASPVIDAPAPVIIGSGVTISWQQVPNAESYTLYLSHGSSQLWKTTVDAPEHSVYIAPERLVAEGSYMLLVVPTAAGWTQSENGVFIDVKTPKTDFAIASPKASHVYIPKDTVDIQVNNPSGYNIAVKVTDADGNVTYLPENGSTVNDTFITGKLLYSPRTTGKITLQAMAWPGEKRTTDSAAWYDKARNVTFTVNGPIARSIYLGGASTASNLLTTSLTSMVIKTNNAVTAVSVELDGKPITITKDGVQVSALTAWDSEVNYVRTFSCSLPAATEGLHRYTAVVRDDENREHRRTYTVYAVTPEETQTLYAQHSGVLLYETPAAAERKTLLLSTALTVNGSYNDAVLGKLWHVLTPQGNGYVKQSEVGPQRQYDYDSMNIVIAEPMRDVADFKTSGNLLLYDWSCAEELPSNAMFNLYKRAEGGSVWQLVTATTGYGLGFTPSRLGQGTWKMAVAINVNGQDYAFTEFPGKTMIFETAEAYLNYIQYQDPDGVEYDILIGSVANTYDSMEMAHQIFTTGVVIDGVFYPPTPIESFVDQGVFQFYYNVFGEGMPMERDTMAQLTVVSAVMESLAPQAVDLGGEKVYKAIVKLVDLMDFADEHLSGLLTAFDKLFNKQNKKLSQISEALSIINVDEIEQFSKAKDGADIGLDLMNAIIMAVRYSMVDTAKLEKIANGFLMCNNTNMQTVGNMLLELRSMGGVAAYSFAMFEFDVAKFLKGKLTDTVADIVKSLGWVGKLYMTVAEGALMFNELTFNTNAMQNAAALCSWWVTATDDYLPTFENAMADFRENPIKNYDSFVVAAETYLRLLDNEYKTFCDMCDTVNNAGWSKLKGIFSKKDDEMKASVERNRGFVDQLRFYMDYNLREIYIHCLAKFGVTYNPLDK